MMPVPSTGERTGLGRPWADQRLSPGSSGPQNNFADRVTSGPPDCSYPRTAPAMRRPSNPYQALAGQGRRQVRVGAAPRMGYAARNPRAARDEVAKTEIESSEWLKLARSKLGGSHSRGRV